MGIARKKSAQKLAGSSANRRLTNAALPRMSAPPLVLLEFLLFRAEAVSRLLAMQIDNVQSAKFATAEGLVELDLQLLVAFSDAPISSFRVIRSTAGLDSSELGALEATAINSPGLAQQHPSLPWASNSRFVVKTTVSAAGSVPGDLLTIAAQVGNQLRPVSRIYITGIAATANEEDAG